MFKRQSDYINLLTNVANTYRPISGVELSGVYSLDIVKYESKVYTRYIKGHKMRLIAETTDLSACIFLYSHICLLRLILRALIELAGFFTSIKAYRVAYTSFIYINITTEY